jgi:hypothetical protein
LAASYADWGKVAAARAVHQEVTARQARSYVPFTELAATAAAAGEPELALDLARKALDAREPVFLLKARVFPDIKRLRDDPRFEEIVSGLSLPGRDG